MDQSETPERGFQQDPLGKENRRAGKYENLTPPPTSHFDGSDFDLVLPSTSIAAAIAALRGGSLLHPLGPDPNQCRDESQDAEKLGVSQAARLLPHVVQRREKVRHVLHGAQARLVRRPTRPGRVLQHWFRARAPARELGLRDESEKGKRDREGEREGDLGLPARMVSERYDTISAKAASFFTFLTASDFLTTFAFTKNCEEEDAHARARERETKRNEMKRNESDRVRSRGKRRERSR